VGELDKFRVNDRGVGLVVNIPLPRLLINVRSM
jgi:hypothetical protein